MLWVQIYYPFFKNLFDMFICLKKYFSVFTNYFILAFHITCLKSQDQRELC